ncbi:hypothetical protein Vadar_027109 [Vaccinium darrowii]|uniref:Uncharacterized protein n=1 Tax=Vaccinium darrowii TaxID=229202 RepID=A0ACB7Y219_9ERIC|nr:hypothetical protein Vadar_027109 [Vaccinium darrowii]
MTQGRVLIPSLVTKKGAFYILSQKLRISQRIKFEVLCTVDPQIKIGTAIKLFTHHSKMKEMETDLCIKLDELGIKMPQRKELQMLVHYPTKAQLTSSNIVFFIFPLGGDSLYGLSRVMVPDCCFVSVYEDAPYHLYFEQSTNSLCLYNQWGLGMEISNVDREEMERLLRELMVGENGKRMKAKAMQWKKLAEDAISAPAGSSYVNFDSLVNNFLLSPKSETVRTKVELQMRGPGTLLTTRVGRPC